MYTDIGDNESWHAAKLPSREKTIVRAACSCVRDVHYICVRRVEGGRRRREDNTSEQMMRQTDSTVCVCVGERTTGPFFRNAARKMKFSRVKCRTDEQPNLL